MTGAGFRIGGPAPRAGFEKSEHLGHLLGFVEAKAKQVPQYNGEGTQLVAHCPFVFCVMCNRVFVDVTVYGEFLAQPILDANQEICLLILAQAPSKMPGRNPAWIPEDPSEEDNAAANTFVNRYVNRLKSGSITVEQPPEAEQLSF